MLNLDTHMVISVLMGELSENERASILNQQLTISDIVNWEIAKLVQLGRLRMDLHSIAFRQFLEHLKILPITIEIAIRSTQLDFTSDPADEIIAATSIVHNVPLLTRDRQILQSKIVPLA